jgi:hypothetical protein
MPVGLQSAHCLGAADVEEALFASLSYLSDIPSSRLRSLARQVPSPFVWISANFGEYDFSNVVFNRSSYQITEFPNDPAEFCHLDNVRDSADACAGVLQLGLVDKRTNYSSVIRSLTHVSSGYSALASDSRIQSGFPYSTQRSDSRV